MCRRFCVSVRRGGVTELRADAAAGGDGARAAGGAAARGRRDAAQCAGDGVHSSEDDGAADAGGACARAGVPRAQHEELVEQLPPKVHGTSQEVLHAPAHRATAHPDDVPQGAARRAQRQEGGLSDARRGPAYSKVVEEADQFLAWLAEHLTAALFPGASFERNIMALELFVITIDVWQPARARFPDPQIAEIKCSEEDDLRIKAAIFHPKAVHAVINCVVNSFDYVRKQALEVLMRFPSPPPGIEERPALLRLLAWSESLINSPRARESDAGSLIVKVVYNKYVKELGWYLSLFPSSDITGEQDSAAAAAAAGTAQAVPPTIFFLRKLTRSTSAGRRSRASTGALTPRRQIWRRPLRRALRRGCC